MRRRARAITFAGAAAICAGLAAGAAGGAGTALEAQLGELRPALVTIETLPARRTMTPRSLAESIEVRRVPVRFLPPDVLTTPAQLLGRAPAADVPAGSYVVASQLRSQDDLRSGPPARLEPGTRPVEIVVSGAGALAASESTDRRVDVVVTTEGGAAGGAGRTYVAARAVELIDLSANGAEGGADVLPGPALDAWTATLALTRTQALRLIHAESFARSVRLIAS